MGFCKKYHVGAECAEPKKQLAFYTYTHYTYPRSWLNLALLSELLVRNV